MLAAPASSRGLCQEGVSRRPKVISEDFLKLALRRDVWIRRAAVVGLLAVLGPRLWLVGFHVICFGWWWDADPTFGSLVLWWGRRPCAARRRPDPTFPPDLSKLGHLLVFVLHPNNRTSVAQGLFKVGPGAGLKLTRTRRFQKCYKLRRHSLKEGAPQVSEDKPNLSGEG